MESVNLPPIHVPITEPKPKALIIQLTCSKEKVRSSVRYNDKNGMTIVPDLLTNVISASHQTSVDRPLNVLM